MEQLGQEVAPVQDTAEVVQTPVTRVLGGVAAETCGNIWASKHDGTLPNSKS